MQVDFSTIRPYLFFFSYSFISFPFFFLLLFIFPLKFNYYLIKYLSLSFLNLSKKKLLK